jgi:hypothetical protein
MNSINLFFLIYTIYYLQSYEIEAICHLPSNWSGKWYQSKDSDLLNITRTSFINRGTCIEHKQDKYIFYEAKEDCFRCIFIMQKHSNVLQYRASYCTDQADFSLNCQNLSPESELNTIYRDDSLAEKCPLGGLYVLANNNNNKCLDNNNNQESMIMECSDQSMLKLQFGKCTNMPTFIVNCMAHWQEGNTNYLIGKIQTTSSSKTNYRCLVYTSSTTTASASSSLDSSNNNPDLLDLTNNNNQHQLDQSQIQLSISQDEFCRSIENGITDEYQMSFTFNKVHGSKYHVAPPSLSIDSTPSSTSNKPRLTHRSSILKSNCKFPKWLNKKWHNLKQSKLFALDYRLDSFLVQDEKNSIIINKYTCVQMKSKKSNHNHYIQTIVKSLNGCSSGYQCLTIQAKSDFVLEIKFGKISYTNWTAIDCNENHSNYISQEFVYVDTTYGVKCPLRNGLYEKLDSKTNRALPLKQQEQEQFHQSSCKYLTQSQTLQIGCQNDQQYSLRTKLCYPNQQYNSNNNNNLDLISSPATTAYTQLESEINLVCLAHWKQDGNYVIVSRTMSNEILCSVWSESENGKFLQLLEIDSNCNYNSKNKGVEQQQRINYGFVYVNTCDEQAAAYASVPTSNAIILFNIFNIFSIILNLFLFYFNLNVFI